jgi:hypothetical protein
MLITFFTDTYEEVGLKQYQINFFEMENKNSTLYFSKKSIITN